MKSHDASAYDGGHVSLLTPPVSNSRCSRCGVWKRLLSWSYVDANECWGEVCDECAAPILASSLRTKLRNRFSIAEFADTCLKQLGLESKRAAFLLEDFVKQGFVSTSEDRFFWHEESGGIVEDEIRGRRMRNQFLIIISQYADEKGFAATMKLGSLTGGQAVLPSQSRPAPRETTAPDEPSISLPSTLPLENRNFCCWREAEAVVPLAQPRRTWRGLSPVEIEERCRRLSRELLREAGHR